MSDANASQKAPAAKYTRCFVAFLDVLGWERLTARSVKDAELLNVMIRALNAIHDTPRTVTYKKTAGGEVASQVQVRTFSDCVCIFSPLAGASLGWVLNSIRYLHDRMIELRLLVRGAITIGDMHWDDRWFAPSDVQNQLTGDLYGLFDQATPQSAPAAAGAPDVLYERGQTGYPITFGPAIAEAYNLERNKAKYPRVIVSQALEDWLAEPQPSKEKSGGSKLNNATPAFPFLKNGQVSEAFREDQDGCRFVDFLAPNVLRDDTERIVRKVVDGRTRWVWQRSAGSYQAVLAGVDAILAMAPKDERVREKHAWLKAYRRVTGTSYLMADDIRDRRSRCFVLGAGFSKGAGLPLASELTPLLWRYTWRADPLDESLCPPQSGPTERGYQDMEEQRRLIASLFPTCACDWQVDSSWPDFEQLITTLDEVSIYQQSYERVTAKKTDNVPERAKQALMYDLPARFDSLSRQARLDDIRTFVGSLDPEHDTVITFNWDVLIEIVAQDAGIPISYQRGAGKLAMLKPHGSLNLVDSPLATYQAERQGAINVYGLTEELKYAEDSTDRVVLRADDPKQAWVRHAWAKKLLIVEPNTRKRYDGQWLDLQWALALQAVREASEIIVIGFSLPESDLRPRLLFQLAKRNRTPEPTLTIVDPNARSLAKRYQRLTGLNAIPVQASLGQWLPRMNVKPIARPSIIGRALGWLPGLWPRR